ncbi:MAG: carbamoyl-phosphate synthase large subunit [Planctomycetes bacterium]|nr:carbamoyl-phosphate synthase large subunit [Planctomycetota bacterium]
MPARKDIKKILLIGSGPIVIGQACEFDYSGAQGCKALKEEGYTVILVNSNPATIMTDPELSDRTYIEPITPEVVAKIIEKERPDALLPTLGGQTALNIAVQLAENRVLDEFGVQMIGVTEDVIRKAEDRKLFKAAMERAGLDVPKSDYAHTLDEARKVCEKIGLPCVIRPSFTLGGSGGGIAYNKDEFETFVSHGLSLSMIGEVLIEKSIYGWKEYELEVMRDRKNNVVIVCSIENFDPMGIHTGDSITVAPAQTLTDKEYQLLRDASIKIMREIGVETGGSNIQFAINPKNGRLAVIEMNPRVSRSSALASKATGFPIAKFATKLAVGYTLDEISNDITKKTPACFEPAIDYCVVKTPRWAFEKFKDADPTLGVQMKSVGETMSIGRTFKEALQKSVRSLEIARMGFGLDRKDLAHQNTLPAIDEIRKKLISPNAERLFYIRYAMKAGMDIKTINELTAIDPWFLNNLKQIIDFEDRLGRHKGVEDVPYAELREAKRYGFSDPQLAVLWKTTPDKIRNYRKQKGITPTYKLVDTCAAEFEAYTPYYYSTYETEDESKISNKKKIMILGGGPNRIGQGIEFDYCCVHASFALRELGYETIMVNSNPETVSTDYDTSDLLYFEPLTEEDILNICDRLNPDGVIVQFGGQTPLNLAKSLQKNGIHIIGTSPDSIDRAEDRHKFNELIKKTGLNQPPGAIVYELDKAVDFAKDLGYPVIVRPSYVLGGRAMEIVYDDKTLLEFLTVAADVSPGHPILIDKFLEDAIEVDVDALADGETVVIAGMMEHIEEAGVHSGDASMTLPPYTLSDQQIAEIRRATHILARELSVCGLMNIQFAVKGEIVYVLEVNPRASRTVPFVSKAIGVPIAKIAAKLMVGKKLVELGFTSEVIPEHFSVKESVFPFKKFTGVDIILGPEMRSTGEVMGIDKDLGQAFYKATLAASHELPLSGNVFISVKDSDKRDVIFIAKRLEDLGFKIYATSGTGRVLERNGITVNYLKKISEGRPSPLDMIINGELNLIINTPIGKGSRTDEGKIRASAVTRGITVITTIPGAQAAVNGIGARKKKALEVQPLQHHYALMKTGKKIPQTAAVI